MDKKTEKRLFFGLIGCGCLGLTVPIIGILAAIAIPAFLSYVKRAKAAEASATVARLANEVMVYQGENCKFPPPLPRSADPAKCCGDIDCVQSPKGWPAEFAQSVQGMKHFTYSGAPVKGENAYEIVAKGDLFCGGPMHTVSIVVTVENKCIARLSDPIIVDSLE